MKNVILFLIFFPSFLNATEADSSNSFIEQMKGLCLNTEATHCSSELYNIGQVNEDAVVYIKQPEFIFDKYCVELENKHELSSRVYTLNSYIYVGRSINGTCSDYIRYTQEHDGKSLYIDANALDFIFSIKDVFHKNKLRSKCLNKSDVFYKNIDIYGVNIYPSIVDAKLKYEISISQTGDDVLFTMYFDSTTKVEECEGVRGQKP
ncbi:hypothetical protein H5202_13130 [Shewanella sp. SG41-4]|uniref:hypothetical protein n=1 Tax=Shewanella sp. SG41-4 TaxID=2760976 RepID=UPI001601E451|nr:hypothetical protein [Shewanella sp. SG41-4]MBB1439598.1 hypothetical protein [Shewanella sp. SG41-4]